MRCVCGVFRAARTKRSRRAAGAVAVVLAQARRTDELPLFRDRRIRGAGPFGSPNVTRNASSDSFRLDLGISGTEGGSSVGVGRRRILAPSSCGSSGGAAGVGVISGSDEKIIVSDGLLGPIFAGT